LDGLRYPLVESGKIKDYGYISNQILIELYCTLTKKVHKKPKTSEEAWEYVDWVKSSFDGNVKPITDEVIDKLVELGEKYQTVSGIKVYDMQIVATMLNYDIDTIITANDKDFAIFEPEGIKIINPFK